MSTNMSVIIAIDPGPLESAWLQWSIHAGLLGGGMVSNSALLGMVRTHGFLPPEGSIAQKRGDVPNVAIEMIACYGMPVGKETFETCLLIGRLQEAFERNGSTPHLVYRKDVKMHLCHSMRAKDANIRAALIDKHGAPGTKKSPGKTYGISGHLWAALAVADYALSTPDHPPRHGP